MTPHVTVLTPVFRTPLTFLDECISSVERQTFQDWELLLVDDGNDRQLATWLDKRCSGDARIRVAHLSENLGIAGASQAGVQSARGEWLALLDHDDTLSPIALERVFALIDDNPLVDYVYTDEDKINAVGDYQEPFFKPDWSPERFRHVMYTGHLSVLRTSLVREIGGFRAEFEGSQDWDLVLRVAEQARSIGHVPEILYHWRAHAGSTATGVDQKPASVEAGRRAVEEHCARSGIDAEVAISPVGPLRLHRRLTGNPLVSLVIPTFGKVAEIRGVEEMLVLHAIEKLEERTTYNNIELIIVGDSRMEHDAVERLLTDRRFPVVFVDYAQPPDGFNFSDKVNVGATRASGDVLVLFNDDIEVVTPNWVEEFLGYVQETDVGAVGGMYYFEDDTIQHAGVISVLGARHLFYKWARGRKIFGHHLTAPRESTILTAACLMVTRRNFVKVGGFTHALPNNFNDVDFCMKLNVEGLRNIWTPHVEMYHFESKSRVNSVREFEAEVLQRRWGTRFLRDANYNPNLQVGSASWEEYSDWDAHTRTWPEPVHDFDQVDLEGYLDANPDLFDLTVGDALANLREHFRHHGYREGRAQVRSVPRPAFDRNERSLVRATPLNFNVEGYLDANPDLAEHKRREPSWNVEEHFREHGRRERRLTWIQRDVGAAEFVPTGAQKAE